MCKKKEKKPEKEKKQRYQAFLDNMKDENAKRYLTERVIPQMEYYSKHSKRNKNWFRALSVISIIFNAIIPIIVIIGEAESIECDFAIKLTIAVISAIAGVLTAVAALYSFRELWLKYRLTLERLKGIVDSYMLRTGEFYSIRNNDDKCLNLLEQLCRAEMDEEHRAWEKLVGEDQPKQA